LRAQGAEPIECPTIQIQPLEDNSALDQALSTLTNYDWIIFTSVHGVRSVLSRLRDLGREAAALSAARLAAIGPSTAKELAGAGLRVDYQPGEYVAEAIVEGLEGVAGKRILLPRADIAREALAVGLREKGAVVDEVAAYRTVPAASQAGSVRQRLAAGEIDVVTFTSSSTVRNFLALLEQGTGNKEEEVLGLLRGVKIACIGPITSQTAREMGLQVDVEAREYTIPGLVEALVEAYEKKGK
ncbi:MAG: uroporphyrinogen-III synthase, partial [Dehalococcoidia bacterium]|nr:uroporphyrinogen-III synthase [Dehalococcoidia bacterium]